MSELFATVALPSQLDIFTIKAPDLHLVEEGLAALGFKRGSPGYKAIEYPQTPVDKAFQIYALVLTSSYDFQRESTDYKTMWLKRDAAWARAADWLIKNEEPFKSVAKTEDRSLKKELPEALRVQCSHELPPGSWVDFPKDGTRQSKERSILTDKLQKIGLNRKIQAMDLVEPSKIHWAEPAVPLKDYGRLENLIEIAKMLSANTPTTETLQTSLF